MIEKHPAPGYMLVQLGEYYAGVKMPESHYDSKTQGLVLKVSPVVRTKDHTELTAWAQGLEGKYVHWREYAEGKRLTFEGKQEAFVRIEDIEGVEQ